MIDREMERAGTEEPISVEDLMAGLLRYEEILGVIAISVEGLVMGAAGVGSEDLDLAAALGASLVGGAERTTRRLGAGAAIGVSVTTPEGMMHLRNGGEFALILFTERCDTLLLNEACDEVMHRFSEVLSPA